MKEKGRHVIYQNNDLKILDAYEPNMQLVCFWTSGLQMYSKIAFGIYLCWSLTCAIYGSYPGDFILVDMLKSSTKGSVPLAKVTLPKRMHQCNSLAQSSKHW